jgi:hypothetical protein
MPRPRAELSADEIPFLARESVRRAVAEAEVAMCRLVRDEIAYLAPS